MAGEGEIMKSYEQYEKECKKIRKENEASLKKFYQYLYEDEKITKDSLQDMKERIKEDMPEWLATMGRYDDPNIESMEEVWDI